MRASLSFHRTNGTNSSDDIAENLLIWR